MSRFKVGGLALVIKGDKYVEDISVGKQVNILDSIIVGCEEFFFVKALNCNPFWCKQHRLIPLGDKETQDILKQEIDY